MVFTWCPELLYSTTLRNVPCDILAISLTASHLFFFLSINKNRILMKTLSNKCIKFSDTAHHVTLQISHVGYTREWSISEDQRKKASPFLYKITDVHTSRWKYQGCVLIYRIAVQCRHLTFTLWWQKHKCIYTHLKKKKKHYLRCKVLWCTTEGLHGSSISDALLAEPKICDFDMAIFIQH